LPVPQAMMAETRSWVCSGGRLRRTATQDKPSPHP
jgi:hypothetical protein